MVSISVMRPCCSFRRAASRIITPFSRMVANRPTSLPRESTKNCRYLPTALAVPHRPSVTASTWPFSVNRTLVASGRLFALRAASAVRYWSATWLRQARSQGEDCAPAAIERPARIRTPAHLPPPCFHDLSPQIFRSSGCYVLIKLDAHLQRLARTLRHEEDAGLVVQTPAKPAGSATPRQGSMHTKPAPGLVHRPRCVASGKVTWQRSTRGSADKSAAAVQLIEDQHVLLEQRVLQGRSRPRTGVGWRSS